MSTAHRTTQRRTLADPDSMKASSRNPTLKNHQRLTNPPNPNPDPTPIIKPSSFGLKTHSLSKSLNFSQAHKFRAPQKPTSLKAMSVSAMVEKSREEEEEEEKKSDHRLAVSSKGIEEELKRKKKERHLVSPVPSSVSVGGRRRSFGGTHIELSDVFASNGVKVVSVDMPPVMQIHAVELARRVHDSLEKFTSKTLASTLKKEFDGIYGPAWHCIVGTSFGSFVTHSVGGFLYFSMDQKLYILLFKTTVQRAD